MGEVRSTHQSIGKRQPGHLAGQERLKTGARPQPIGDWLPDADGRFLGETTTPRRWDGSRLLGVMRLDGSLLMTGTFKSTASPLAIQLGDESTQALGGIQVFNPGYSHPFLEKTSFYADKNLTFLYDAYIYGLTLLSGASLGLEDDDTVSIGDPTHRLNAIHTMGLYLYGTAVQTDMKFIPVNDVSIFIGKDEDSSLPMASEGFRGKMIRVEGGIGAADKLYCCLKKADDTYAWVQVASG